MEFDKLKLGFYDLFGLVLPGLLGISESWILIRGWASFAGFITQLTAFNFTLLTIISIAVGNLVQELGDTAIKWWRGERFFKAGRDDFWESSDAQIVKAVIKETLNHEIKSVDTAFDYCLTMLGDKFSKYETFLATSDLSRSLFVLLITAILPAARVAWERGFPNYLAVILIVFFLLCIAFSAWLAWNRMVRFRELSEKTVFRAFLAVSHDATATGDGGKQRMAN